MGGVDAGYSHRGHGANPIEIAISLLLVGLFRDFRLSLVFGLLSSTVLTVLAIPAIYVWLRDDGKPLPEGLG